LPVAYPVLYPAAVPGSYLVLGQYKRLGRIHVLTVAVAAAYALQTGALALELAHLVGGELHS
jgi:hypothetical protein